eukprot:3421748-Rhodomonas_salina.3
MTRVRSGTWQTPIALEGCALGWNASRPILDDVNIKIPKGSLTVVRRPDTLPCFFPRISIPRSARVYIYALVLYLDLDDVNIKIPKGSLTVVFLLYLDAPFSLEDLFLGPSAIVHTLRVFLGPLATYI